MNKHKNGYVTPEQVATHGVMTPLLQAMYLEFSELSKKKPQEVLSANKVKVVNRLLTPILGMLENEPMRPFLDVLDEDDLPQNSDVILMLSQVRAAMHSFRERHCDSRGWHVES